MFFEIKNNPNRLNQTLSNFGTGQKNHPLFDKSKVAHHLKVQ